MTVDTEMSGTEVWMSTHFFVSDSKKDRFNKKVRHFQQEAVNHDNTCLFAIDESGTLCGQPAVRCHSIPRASVLTQLRDEVDGKVLDISAGLDLWRHTWNKTSQANPIDINSTTTFEPRRCGINDASVGHFACATHDKIFAPIDIEPHNFEGGRTSFLNAYRPFLYVYDLWRKYGVFLHDKIRLTVRERHNKFATLEYAKRCESKKNIDHELQNHARKLGNIWCNNDTLWFDEPDLAATQIYNFRSELKFAASLMIGVSGLCVTVCPGQGDLHSMILSYLTEDCAAVNRQIEPLKELAYASQVSDDYGVKMMTELLSIGFGSMAASPLSYTMLNNDKSEAIKQCIYNLSQPHLMHGILQSDLAKRKRHV